MNWFRNRLVLLGIAGLAAVANAHADIECACDGDYYVGAPVVMVNDTGPGPGATGRVIAGRDGYMPILVEWDDWYGGTDGGFYESCTPYYPRGSSRQWVKCAEIELREDHTGERVWCACDAKFHVGQRVHARIDLYEGVQTGSLGTILGGVPDDDGGRLLVEWDDFFGGNGGEGMSECPPVAHVGCSRLWVPCWAISDQELFRDIDCTCNNQFDTGDHVFLWIDWGNEDFEVRYGTAIAGDPWFNQGMIAVAFRDSTSGGGIQDGAMLCPPVQDQNANNIEWVDCEGPYGIDDYQLDVMENSAYGCPGDALFQPGDRVVNTASYGAGPAQGEYGTVVAGSLWQGTEVLLVAWDEFTSGHNGLRANFLCPRVELSGNNRYFVYLDTVASVGEHCPSDVNQDGMIDGADLTHVLAYWGPCSCFDAGNGICHADINGDGSIDGADITHVLAAWGACPE